MIPGSWTSYFPEKQPRQLQIKILDELVEAFQLHDNFIISAPTGVGKSAIAVCMARWLASQKPNGYIPQDDRQPYSTYVTTTSIYLQEVYESSYSSTGLRKLYAADHFRCNRGRGLSCGDGKRINSAREDSKCPGGTCPYTAAKADFIRSDFGVLNTAYYTNETYYAGQLVPRGLHIFDECHTIGELVKNFVTIEITQKELAKYLLTMPRPECADGSYDIKNLVKWVRSPYLDKVMAQLSKLCQKRDAWEGSEEDRKFLEIVEECTELDKRACRIRRMINRIDGSPNGWVGEQLDGGIHLTPVTPTEFMDEILFSRSDKNLLLSATVLDPAFMMKEYDLEPERTLVFESDSPFPVANRPIIFWPVGKLKHGDLANSMAPFAKAMNELLHAHPNERGIVFVSSYAQAEELIRQTRSPRLITHKTSREKDELMSLHRRSQNTVLVSPSMMEGVDLKDDLSRFQVILKIPFPSLDSKAIRVRMEQNPDWYAYATALQIIQASGRSIRSETDYATTYILDSHWSWWYPRWERFFPDWWRRALQ